MGMRRLWIFGLGDDQIRGVLKLLGGFFLCTGVERTTLT